jgi:hypothetical protein
MTPCFHSTGTAGGANDRNDEATPGKRENARGRSCHERHADQYRHLESLYPKRWKSPIFNHPRSFWDDSYRVPLEAQARSQHPLPHQRLNAMLDQFLAAIAEAGRQPFGQSNDLVRLSQ